MPADITYDKDGNKVPSREFLSMLIILLRKCGVEADMSLLHFLEGFEDRDSEIDAYEDDQLRKAVSIYMKDNYDDPN